MTLEDEPFDTDIAALLNVERERPALARNHVDALRTNVERAVFALGDGGGDGGDGGDGGPSAPPAPTGSAGAGVLSKLVQSHPGVALTLAFAAGSGAGATAVATLPSPKAQMQHAQIATPPSVATTAAVTATEPLAPVSVPSVTPPAPKASTTKPSKAALSPGAPDAELGHERALLEKARTALDRGNALAALTTLADYDTAHPHGRLIEERDALRIQATWAAGQHEQARTLADAFKARYPRSLLLPAIEEIGR